MQLYIYIFKNSISVIRVLRFPSLKFGTICLAMLITFEISCVYVIPLFTPVMFAFLSFSLTSMIGRKTNRFITLKSLFYCF